MSPPQLTERTLAELSKIEVRYFTGSAGKGTQRRDVLVVRYAGTYAPGSAGGPDSRYMLAMARAGVEAFNPDAVIHDLSELSYVWGDDLEQVFIGSGLSLEPVAVIVGPGCEEAVRTLVLGERSDKPLEAAGYVFRDLPAAWAYVVARAGR